MYIYCGQISDLTGYEIQILAADRGLSQHLCAVTLEKGLYHLLSYLIIA